MKRTSRSKDEEDEGIPNTRRTGNTRAETTIDPRKVRGTAPGNCRWSHSLKFVPCRSASWQAWRLKLSSTFVKGVRKRWIVTTASNKPSQISSCQGHPILGPID